MLLQGQATCSFGNVTVLAEGSEVAQATALLSASQCESLSLAHTGLSICGCHLYQTAFLLAARVSSRYATCINVCFISQADKWHRDISAGKRYVSFRDCFMPCACRMEPAR